MPYNKKLGLDILEILNSSEENWNLFSLVPIALQGLIYSIQDLHPPVKPRKKLERN